MWQKKPNKIEPHDMFVRFTTPCVSKQIIYNAHKLKDFADDNVYISRELTLRYHEKRTENRDKFANLSQRDPVSLRLVINASNSMLLNCRSHKNPNAVQLIALLPSQTNLML